MSRSAGTSTVARVNGIELAYQVFGSGTPLILLHGGFGSVEMFGPNVQLLRDVCAATSRPVVASGGVSSLDDLRQLAGLVDIGVEGSIVGKALYAGAFTLPEALAAVG